jgi:Uri superfamily endonuclease
MESQDIDMFGISDIGEEAALFQNKPKNTESPLKKV